MVQNTTIRKKGQSVVIEKKKEYAPKSFPMITAGHEFIAKFSEVPEPKIGEREIHDIIIRLDQLPFFVKMSLKKKQWNKLIKAVDAAGDSWIAAARGKIKRIDRQVIYLENVGFQVFERKPRQNRC